jgi:hypothetical protein
VIKTKVSNAQSICPNTIPPPPRTTEPLLGDDATEPRLGDEAIEPRLGEEAGECCGELCGDWLGDPEGEAPGFFLRRAMDRNIFLRRISFFQFWSFHFHSSFTLM